ncbi:hypothetical protein [Pseudomonas sp. NPDC007930]|uniref:hypothetical protein n=1 Tax=Pseudomonas sp. NPDC007930 TaxID=3364417 RepID=UPI0036E3F66D
MRSLLTRLGLLAPRRTYALLDSNGLCSGFHTGTQAPAGYGWVQVPEARLHWLGRPLPAEARLPARASGRNWARAFAG